MIRVARPSSERGNCCACHDWHEPTWQLSTRASICQKCCERKSSEVLGSIASAERKARRYAKSLTKDGRVDAPNVKFYARLSGVSEEFMRAAIAKVYGAQS
ncbi:MAG: hypothetical protein RB191_11500 [Terriglobia bacterium]|nr:hypothetical protein [Terriglobia bacterium]